MSRRPCFQLNCFIASNHAGQTRQNANRRAYGKATNSHRNRASRRVLVQAIVHSFLDRGYNVVATSRRSSNAGFAPSANLALVDGDIGQAATAEKVIQTAIDRFGTIDHVVNNAGIFLHPNLLRTTHWMRFCTFCFDQPEWIYLHHAARSEENAFTGNRWKA